MTALAWHRWCSSWLCFDRLRAGGPAAELGFSLLLHRVHWAVTPQADETVRRLSQVHAKQDHAGSRPARTTSGKASQMTPRGANRQTIPKRSLDLK